MFTVAHVFQCLWHVAKTSCIALSTEIFALEGEGYGFTATEKQDFAFLTKVLVIYPGWSQPTRTIYSHQGQQHHKVCEKTPKGPIVLLPEALEQQGLSSGAVCLITDYLFLVLYKSVHSFVWKRQNMLQLEKS